MEPKIQRVAQRLCHGHQMEGLFLGHHPANEPDLPRWTGLWGWQFQQAPVVHPTGDDRMGLRRCQLREAPQGDIRGSARHAHNPAQRMTQHSPDGSFLQRFDQPSRFRAASAMNRPHDRDVPQTADFEHGKDVAMRRHNLCLMLTGKPPEQPGRAQLRLAPRPVQVKVIVGHSRWDAGTQLWCILERSHQDNPMAPLVQLQRQFQRRPFLSPDRVRHVAAPKQDVHATRIAPTRQ